MLHAEPLLFVNHQQSQILELNVFAKEPVGAYDQIYFAVFQLFLYFFLLRFAPESRKHLYVEGKSCEPLFKRVEVLICQYGGRH